MAKRKDWLDENSEVTSWITHRQIMKEAFPILRQIENEWFKATFGDFHTDAQVSFMKFIEERIKE